MRLGKQVVANFHAVVFASPSKLQKRVSDDEAARFLALLHTATTIVRLDELVAVVDADPDDNKFVAVAVASHAKAIISGDGHLLELGGYQDIAILTPAQFLDHVTKQQPGESA